MGLFLNSDDELADYVHTVFQRDLDREPSEQELQARMAQIRTAGAAAFEAEIWDSAEAKAFRAKHGL